MGITFLKLFREMWRIIFLTSYINEGMLKTEYEQNCLDLISKTWLTDGFEHSAHSLFCCQKGKTFLWPGLPPSKHTNFKATLFTPHHASCQWRWEPYTSTCDITALITVIKPWIILPTSLARELNKRKPWEDPSWK